MNSSAFFATLKQNLFTESMGSIGVIYEDLYFCCEQIFNQLSGEFKPINYEYISKFSEGEELSIFLEIIAEVQHLISDGYLVIIISFGKILEHLELWKKQLIQEKLRQLFYQVNQEKKGQVLWIDELERESINFGFSLNYPLPNRASIRELLASELMSEDFDSLLAGLGEQEIKGIIKGLKNQLSSASIPEILRDYKEKKFKGLGLELLAIPANPSIGGLDRIVEWIEQVAQDFQPLAREMKIPLPRGALLVGPPGTGKTHTAKVCAYRLGFPLINVGVDLVKHRGSDYLKTLLHRVEQLGKSVLYFDEIDKFFEISEQGTLQGSKDVLGVLLTWLQERTSPTLVLATLNRLESLPPELTRAGRFDCLFYVGFPGPRERVEILILYASVYDSRYQSLEDNPLELTAWQRIVDQSGHYTGSELKRVVEIMAKKQFYCGKKDIRFELPDFLSALGQVTSLFSRDSERILIMENRAKMFCLPASTEDRSPFAPLEADLWGDPLIRR